VLTEKSVRNLLETKINETKNWYAPIDFGHGLAIPGFWSIGSGTGRWDVIKSIVSPVVKDKRVLDLGSNNGVMPLMMLRDGAKSVFGVELSNEYFDSALLIKDIFEWRDIREYDFHLHHGNMLEILDSNWGEYDVVTAFCSLYYLSENDMAKVVRRSSELAPAMILQANTATRSEAAEEKTKKSSVAFMTSLLKDNGYPKVEIQSLKGYSRPILIGKR
jgi:SAM-dependent methyltransferase